MIKSFLLIARYLPLVVKFVQLLEQHIKNEKKKKHAKAFKEAKNGQEAAQHLNNMFN